MEFAHKLKALRTQKKLSESELAEVLNTSSENIVLWEEQKAIPDFKIIIKLSEIFEITLDQLINDDIDIENNDTECTDILCGSQVEIEKIPDESNKIFCTACGKENKSDSKFCGYCGQEFKSLVNIESNLHKFTKEETELAYYQMNLKMQQQQLLEQRRQFEEQQRQYEAVMKCPRCGSTSLSGDKKGYGIGKGVVGAAMFGPLGLVAGNIGSKKVIVTCMKCGYKFKR